MRKEIKEKKREVRKVECLESRVTKQEAVVKIQRAWTEK